MPSFTDTPYSVRQGILNAVVAAFSAIQPPDFPVTPSLCVLGHLSDLDNRKQFTIGIVAQTEKYGNSYPYQERSLTVAAEFRYARNATDEPVASLAERVLTAMEQVVLSDGTWGGRAILTNLTSNDIDLDTYADRAVQGMVSFTIVYRHSSQSNILPNPAP